jgi:hypothetical protein
MTSGRSVILALLVEDPTPVAVGLVVVGDGAIIVAVDAVDVAAVAVSER